MAKGLRFLIVVYLIFFSNTYACTYQGKLDDPGSMLRVSDLSYSYAGEGNHGEITTLGTLTNTSKACLQYIVVEVKYFDSQNNLVDVFTEDLYDVVVPPGQSAAFRVRGTADKAKSLYSKNTVKVVYAEPRYVRTHKSNEIDLWVNFISSWSPLLVFIIVWVLVMRKFTGKKSTQARMLGAIEQQNELITDQVKILERLAIAAEKLRS